MVDGAVFYIRTLYPNASAFRKAIYLSTRCLGSCCGRLARYLGVFLAYRCFGADALPPCIPGRFLSTRTASEVYQGGVPASIKSRLLMWMMGVVYMRSCRYRLVKLTA